MITTTWQIQRKAPDTEPMAGEWLPCGLTQHREGAARDSLDLWRQGRPRDRFRLVRTTTTTEVVA